MGSDGQEAKEKKTGFLRFPSIFNWPDWQQPVPSNYRTNRPRNSILQSFKQLTLKRFLQVDPSLSIGQINYTSTTYLIISFKLVQQLSPQDLVLSLLLQTCRPSIVGKVILPPGYGFLRMNFPNIEEEFS